MYLVDKMLSDHIPFFAGILEYSYWRLDCTSSVQEWSTFRLCQHHKVYDLHAEDVSKVYGENGFERN